jgi:hypothetical protein
MFLFLKYFRPKTGVFDSKQSKVIQKCDIILVLEKKRRFSCRKLSKTIENCDHNIDP